MMKHAYLAAKVFDSKGMYRPNTAILIEDGQIVDLVARDEIPSEYAVTDLGPLTALPGLIDCHVHLVWNGDAHPGAITLRETEEKTAVRTLIHAFEELM